MTVDAPSGRVRLWQWLTEPSATVLIPDQRRRARLLAAMALFLLVFGGLALGVQVLTGPSSSLMLVGMPGVAVLVVVYVLSRTRSYVLGAILAIVALPLINLVVIASLRSTAWLNALFLLPINLIMAGMLFSVRPTALLALFDCTCLVLLPVLMPQLGIAQVVLPLLFVVLVAGLLLSALWNRDFVERDRRFEESWLYHQVAEADARLKAVLENVASGVLLFDTEGGLILANDRAQALLGFGKQGGSGGQALRELSSVGKRSDRLPLDERRESLMRHLATMTRRYDEVVQRRYSVEWPEPHVLDEVATLVLSEDGEVIGRLVILHDVTEWEEAERYHDELTQMVVHDLRSPLAAIIAALKLTNEILAENRLFFGDLRDAFNVAMMNADGLERMVMTMLDFYQLEAGAMPLKPTPIALPEVARMARTMLLSLADASNITIEVTVRRPLEPLVADGNLIVRVITNLLDNALRYTPDGGTVRIEMTGDDEYQQVCVIDEGVGIPEKEREHVFERFVRVEEEKTRHARKGWGLGLAFCKLAVEAHGGRIWLESGEERGTVFYFTLPRTQAGGRQ